MRTEIATTLKRHTTDLINEVGETGESILITQHGLPSAYLVNVDSYEQQQQRIALLEGIARGEQAIQQGRTLSHSEAKDKLARWLK